MADGGLVYDSLNGRLIAAQRNSNVLYLIDWNPSTQTLSYIGPAVELAQIRYACDLTIKQNILFVSEYYYSGTPTYSEVYMYDMNDDFAYLGKVDMNSPIVSLDYNAADNTLYGGAWQGPQDIIKTKLDPLSTTTTDAGANVIGINANSDMAGRVFVTLYGPNREGVIQLWDMSGNNPNDHVMLSEYTNDNPDGLMMYGLAGIEVYEDYINGALKVAKEDDAAEPVLPGQSLTFTLTVTNTSEETATNILLIDYLPKGVDYDDLPDVNYNGSEHTYTWSLPDIAPEQSVMRELTVTVNHYAQPGMILVNKAVVTSSLNTFSVIHETPVACGDSGMIVYVDMTASGYNNGTNWADAYTDLQEALTRIADSDCIPKPDTVYVAQETYKPGLSGGSSFFLPQGAKLYGGFPAGGCDFKKRNPKKYPAVLSGEISPGLRSDTIVTMGQNSRLDGFVVTGAADYGIYGSAVDFCLENNVVIGNDDYGIYAAGGNIAVRWCEIKGCGLYGIRQDNEGSLLTIENTIVKGNSEYGIYSLNSTPTVKNSIIADNDLKGFGRDGIRMINPTFRPVLHNNTFAYNRGRGVRFQDSGTLDDPNDRDWPDVQNCILYFNNADREQYAGFPKEHILYSCIFDPNNPEGSENKDVRGNFSANPLFAYADPNNVHIAWESPCRDAGNPLFTGVHQIDMDKEFRLSGATVDIGADEAACMDASSELDWSSDGVINYAELNTFSTVWKCRDPNDGDIRNDPNFIGHPDYADPDTLAR
jgi:uncharacterized repeat protein (TIGR01451 family)